VIALHDSRRTRVLLAVLLVVALLIITVDYSDSTAAPVRALRSLGSAVFGGAEAATATVVRPFADLFAEDGGQPGKVAALQAQVTRLRMELSQAQLDRQQSDQLNRLLQTAGQGDTGSWWPTSSRSASPTRRRSPWTPGRPTASGPTRPCSTGPGWSAR
jgi:hypothetical protein